MNLYVTKINDAVRDRSWSLNLTLFLLLFSYVEKWKQTCSTSPTSRLKTSILCRLILIPIGQVVVCDKISLGVVFVFVQHARS